MENLGNIILYIFLLIIVGLIGTIPGALMGFGISETSSSKVARSIIIGGMNVIAGIPVMACYVVFCARLDNTLVMLAGMLGIIAGTVYSCLSQDMKHFFKIPGEEAHPFVK